MKTYLYTRLLVSVIFISLIITSCNKSNDPMPSMSTGKILYQENFEGVWPFYNVYSKEVGNWDYALQYVPSPLYNLGKCARFEIRNDQPLVADGKRSEVVITMGNGGIISKNTWYSFMVYFPSENYQFDHTHDVISQWYKDGSPVRLLTREDQLILDIGNEKGTKEEILIGDCTKNTWHQLVFHFIHSHESDGNIEVWFDGESKAQRQGGNMYNAELPKWKVGLYKSSFETGKSDVTQRVIYFDDIRIGNETCSFKQMKDGR